MNAEKLACIILNGPMIRAELQWRLEGLILQKKYPAKLAKKLVKFFGEGSRPSVRSVKDFLQNNKKFSSGKVKFFSEVDLCDSEMSPDRSIALDWKVPPICSTGGLIDLLDIEAEQLDWFASRMGPVEGGSKLDHYNYRAIAKRSGGWRLLEMPKFKLKLIQQRILHGILDSIPAHDASHGFTKGRSIVSYVKPHVGRKLVIKFDLANYFLTVDRSRVRSLFHVAGYPPNVSKYLSELCTHQLNHNDLPAEIRKSVNAWLHEKPHLPQGAPSSPALANCLLYRLDSRLSGLANKMGMSYTRYADDMAFSLNDSMGEAKANYFAGVVTTIVEEEGWLLNRKKTRFMRQSQRQYLAGLVINQKANVLRAEYDQLKATLYRCGLNGLEAENRQECAYFAEQLAGRVDFVAMTNRVRGEKLRVLLEVIK